MRRANASGRLIPPKWQTWMFVTLSFRLPPGVPVALTAIGRTGWTTAAQTRYRAPGRGGRIQRETDVASLHVTPAPFFLLNPRQRTSCATSPTPRTPTPSPPRWRPKPQPGAEKPRPTETRPPPPRRPPASPPKVKRAAQAVAQRLWSVSPSLIVVGEGRTQKG